MPVQRKKSEQARAGGQAAFPALLGEVKREVEEQLDLTLEQSLAQGRAYGDEVAQMIGAVQSLCSRGGKRLRPGLCVVGGLCVSPAIDRAPFVAAGVSLELLQAYFLIHDDWMDQDDQRRGGPTAHVSLSRTFRSRALGERAAILAGDHAVSLAQKSLSKLDISPARLRQALGTFADMQLSAVAGQQLDIIAKTKTPELTYALKTSSYTVTGPLLLGANLAGGSASLCASLEDYGRPTGIAFQLADDLIGVFGDPVKTGKPRGADLTAGKNTPLVQHGFRLLGAKDKLLLRKVLRKRQAGPRELETLVRRLDECGAKLAVSERILELRREGLDMLTQSKVSQLGRKMLTEAAHALTQRDA